MYAKVLVPYDGSEFSRQALDVAVEVARRSEAEILLLQVLGTVVAGEPGEAPESLVEADRRRRDARQADVERTAARIREEGVEATGRLAEGRVSDTLVRVADEEADLVVMATHGRGPFSRFWLGSVADALARRCAVPLLLVKPGEEGEAAPGTESLERIVIPLDGSEVAEAVLPSATALGGLFDARYTVLRVVRPVFPGVLGYEDVPQTVDPSVVEELEDAAEDYLDGVAGRLREAGHRVETRVVRGSSVPWAVVEASNEAAAAVALATRGRSGIERVLMGSTADKVIRAARQPVLLHRSGEAG